MEVTAVQGDIAAQRVDALVSAASTHLRMGSGVAGSLLDAAGLELAAAAREHAPIRPGGVAVTGGFDLDAEYVIHAAATPASGQRRATPATVRRATAGALAMADRLGCVSIAVPPLGCGNGGLHVQDGTRIITETVAAHDSRTLATVRLVAEGRFEADLFERALEKID